MKQYIATQFIDDVEYGAMFSARNEEEALAICERVGWEYEGELVDMVELSQDEYEDIAGEYTYARLRTLH